jgi:transposase InsO family protein
MYVTSRLSPGMCWSDRSVFRDWSRATDPRRLTRPGTCRKNKINERDSNILKFNFLKLFLFSQKMQI